MELDSENLEQVEDTFEPLEYNEEKMAILPYMQEKPLKVESFFHKSTGGCNIDKQVIPHFLLCSPTYSTSDVPNNVWMQEDQKPINQDLYVKQWYDLYQLLSSVGICYCLPPKKGLQDLVYTANAGFMLPHHLKTKSGESAANTFIVSNFRSTPRVGETEHIANFMKQFDMNVRIAPYFFEGAADLKPLAKNILVGGYGIRTDKKFYDWLEKEYDVKIIKCLMQDKYLYHFDCNFFPIGERKVIMCCDNFEDAEIEAIEKEAEIFDIPFDDAYGGTTNSIRAGNMVINASALHYMKKSDKDYESEKKRVETMEDIVRKAGLNPIFIDLSEGMKGGALTSCCCCDLTYTDVLFGEKE